MGRTFVGVTGSWKPAERSGWATRTKVAVAKMQGVFLGILFTVFLGQTM